ncbi:MAG: hypothetical protein HY907_15235 [Deltaproteobacteria bacterium]|nr:hypothetical protein [Deltaproteobacteria bacterium]
MATEEKSTEKKDVFQGVTDAFKSWSDTQRSWLQSTLDGVTKTAERFKAVGGTDSLRAVTELWGKSFDEGLQRLRQFTPQGPAGDVFDKMVSAQSAYLRAMQWWVDALIQQRSGGSMEPQALVDLWSRSYREFLTSIVVPPFAEPMKGWLGALPGGMPSLPAGDLAQSFAQAGQQWMGFVTRMGERTSQVLRGEVKPDAARELYDSWLRGYEETLGRIFHLPSVGPARQLIDKHMRGVDASVKYQAALADFYGKMVQPGMEALHELAAKTQELAKGPMTPETFEKFYQLLLKTVEQRFGMLFRSPPFLAALEHTMHASLEFHSQMNSLLEEQLKGTPIVTRRELDDVLRELHELRREVRSLNKG